MAFSTLSSALIQVGKAVKREIFTTLKDNQDDLNTRVSLIETSGNKIILFDGLVKNAASASSLTGLSVFRCPAAFTLIDAKVGIFEKGSLTGTLEMNIRKSSSLDDTGATSVFTTRPSIAFAGASNYDESSNAVFDGTAASVSEGDFLFLDISSLPSGGVISKFSIYLIGEVS